MIGYLAQLPLLALAMQQPPSTPPVPTSLAAGSASGGPGWLVAVNLLIWTGLFLYLLRLDRRLRESVRDERKDGHR